MALRNNESARALAAESSQSIKLLGTLTTQKISQSTTPTTTSTNHDRLVTVQYKYRVLH
jgi:hypothetical protein